MHKDRREVKDHKNWPMPVIPYTDAIRRGYKCVPESITRTNRHHTPLEYFVTFYDWAEFPVNDEYWLEILPGFTTDWASIPFKPKLLREMLIYNSMDMRRASVTHDSLFNLKVIPFEESNDIFKRIILEDGGSRTKAALCYFGVSTKIGRWHYDNEKEFDRYNRKFCILHKYADRLPKTFRIPV